MLIPGRCFYAVRIANARISYQTAFPAAEGRFGSWQRRWVCSQKTFSSLQEMQRKDV